MSETRCWQASAAAVGTRLDLYLAHELDIARSRVRRWIDEGRILVDGNRARASRRLYGGEHLSLCAPPPEPTSLVAEDDPLEVLYEDDQLVVVDKPAGLIVHPGAGQPSGTLANRLLGRYPELGTVGHSMRPGIVHRLDSGTSGVLVVARTAQAYQRLTQQFASRRIDKLYLALVFGRPNPAAGVIEAPLGRHPTLRTRRAVSPSGRPARTDYQTLASGDPVTLLLLRLHTGRTHQARVHCQHLGHPIVGDETYGGKARGRTYPAPTRKLFEDCDRPALHAWRLELTHPTTGERLRFSASPPRDLTELWARVGTPPLETCLEQSQKLFRAPDR